MRKQGKNGSYIDLYPNGNYDPTAYERGCNTVDMTICRVHDHKLQVLLIQRGDDPFKDGWAIPVGFVNIDSMESLDDAAYRELEEETGVTGIPVTQLTTQGDALRDPRWRAISTVYYALVSHVVIDKTNIIAGDDAKAYRWANVDDIVNGKDVLAFDHKEIITKLLNRLRVEIQYSAIAFTLVPKEFTFAQLQDVYEAVLGRKLLATNFKRNIKHSYIIDESSSFAVSTCRGKKARLCKFVGEIIQF